MSDTSGGSSVESDEDLPTYVVIVIGVICAVIVTALTVVLIVLCYKRRQSIKKYKEDSAKQPTTANRQAVENGSASVPTAGVSQSQPAPSVSDNPATNGEPSPPPQYNEVAMTSVFATSASQHNENDLYQKPSGSSNGYLPDGAATAAYAFENQSNLHRERSFKGSNPMAPSHDVPDTGAYPMNSVPSRNMSSADQGYLYLDDGYRQGNEPHNNSGDGGLGADQSKPKKVMYEVVV